MVAHVFWKGLDKDVTCVNVVNFIQKSHWESWQSALTQGIVSEN